MLIKTAPPRRHDLRRLQRIYDKGDHRKALRLALQALRDLPEHADLYALAGSCARHLGDTRRAVKLYREAIARVGPSSDYPVHLGHILNDTGAFAAALNAFRSVLDLRPDHPAALHGLGVALLGLAKPREALTPLSEAVERAPTNAAYVATLGRAFEWMGLYQEAADSYAVAVSLDADGIDHHVALARALHLTGQADAALAVLDAARRVWPGDGRLVDAASVIWSSLGQGDKASALRREALTLQPENCAGLMNFAHLHDMAQEPEAAQQMRRMLDRAPGDADQMYLRFALTKLCEDLGDYDQAYDHLTRANALRRAQLRYDPAQDSGLFEQMKARFRGAEPAPEAAPPDGPVPIFVLGMPRSGTSLTEAILARHPDVTACGELEALTSLVRRDHLHAVPSGASARALREDYLSLLPQGARGSGFVTDKMPVNFKLIGHIICAMPQARILHVRRDARATCWSNFRHFYASTGNGFSYDPADVVAFYKGYADLMAFWHRQFPGRIVTLDYEALVKDPEAQTRTLLEKLGLPWHDACLTPEAADHAVRTASARQVRQKIYTGSAEGWRRYEPWAGEWLANMIP